MKALVGAFNQEKALVGAFSVIVKTGSGTDGSFYSTTSDPGPAARSLCDSEMCRDERVRFVPIVLEHHIRDRILQREICKYACRYFVVSITIMNEKYLDAGLG